MSVISNVHTAQVYDAKRTKAFEAQRLVVTIAKASKDGSYNINLQQTMATSIPMIDDAYVEEALNNEKIQSHFKDWLMDVQNKMIASRIKTGSKSITTDELGIDYLTKYLDDDSVKSGGDKWTAERIASWFTDNLAEYIGVALIEKGFDDTKMEKSLGLYEKKFSEIFAGRGVIARKVAIDLQKALNLHPQQNDTVVEKFQTRLANALKEVNLIESLGL